MSNHNYRFEDVMETFCIGRSTVYDWIKKGILPKPIKIGTVPLFIGDEIDAVIEERKKARAVSKWTTA